MILLFESVLKWLLTDFPTNSLNKQIRLSRLPYKANTVFTLDYFLAKWQKIIPNSQSFNR